MLQPNECANLTKCSHLIECNMTNDLHVDSPQITVDFNGKILSIFHDFSAELWLEKNYLFTQH